MPNPTRFRLPIVIFLAACSFAPTLAIAQPETRPANATAPSTTVSAAPTTRPAATVHRVERGTLSFVIEATGTFEPVEPFEVRLRPEAYKGELTVVRVAANGAAVKKGDVLLECDPADLTPELEAARNEQTKARANLSKAEADAKLGA